MRVDVVLLILVVAALVGGVVWNRRNAAAATAGVRFPVPAAPDVVADGLRAAHCRGAGATVRGLVSGVRVTPVGPTSFRVESRFGDVGNIEVQPDGAGSVVCAHADELYVGTPRAVQFHGGVMGLSALVMHRLYILLGLCPGAARMNRFQRGIEGRTRRELQGSARA